MKKLFVALLGISIISQEVHSQLPSNGNPQPSSVYGGWYRGGNIGSVEK